MEFRRVNAVDAKGWKGGQAGLSVMDPELKQGYGLLSMCCILILPNSLALYSVNWAEGR